MSWARGFARFVMVTLFAKVRAYLLGGTAAGGLAGLALWGAAELGLEVTAPIAGTTTAAVALLVGLFVAYETRERVRVKGRADQAP